MCLRESRTKPADKKLCQSFSCNGGHACGQNTSVRRIAPSLQLFCRSHSCGEMFVCLKQSYMLFAHAICTCCFQSDYVLDRFQAILETERIFRNRLLEGRLPKSNFFDSKKTRLIQMFMMLAFFCRLLTI